MRYVLIAFLTASILYGPKVYKFFKENVKKIPKVSFEEQFTTFSNLGFTLYKDIDKEELLYAYSKEDYEANPYNLLYMAWGQISENTDKPVSDNCWYFDFESIESEGDYVEILENLKRISGNELNFSNIKDNIDFDNETAWVSFDLNGEHYKYDLVFESDWADHTLFENIVKLTKKYNTKAKFTVHSGGQDVVIDYMTESEFNKFNAVTQLNIEWL